MRKNKKECDCEFCIKCKCCNHRADEHMAGDGPCYMKGCNCKSFDGLWEQNNQSLEQFAEFEVE